MKLVRCIFNPIQDGGGNPQPRTSFFSCTTNVGLSTQNFLTFSFNPFVLLVWNVKVIPSASPKLFFFIFYIVLIFSFKSILCIKFIASLLLILLKMQRKWAQSMLRIAILVRFMDIINTWWHLLHTSSWNLNYI